MTERVAIAIGDHERHASVDPTSSSERVVRVEGGAEPWQAVVLAGGPTEVVAINGRIMSFISLGPGRFFETRTRRVVEVGRARSTRAERTGDAGPSAAELRAPMPGRIVRVLVQAGESVAMGSSVVVIEAMKMENELGAPRSGSVRRVSVRAGDTVERDALLVEIE